MRPSMTTTSLSVLVPVFNEEHLVAASLQRLEVLESSPLLSRIQVVVVDDCSTDSTAQVLERFTSERSRSRGKKTEWVFLRHEQNAGKGAAVRTALARADAEITVVHDADLEYHPSDLLRIVKVFLEEDADAVFGSRFAGGEARRLLFYRHELGNRLLTLLTNVATNLNLTDMETCYKAVRTSLLKSIPLVSNDFRLEPELTIKLAKRQARIFEVPISYSGRTYQEGKKINWRDGVKALAAITRFALSDHVYVEDGYGSQLLGRLARAPRFNAWMADTIRPFVGDHVLEIGSGTGNLTQRLIPRRRYVASDINPLYLNTLEALRGDKPYLSAQYCDVTDVASFPKIEGNFDTVVCLNVIEHVDGDVEALRNVRSVLAPNGRAIVLVPRGERLFGTLDEVLGHRRRYSESTLRDLAAAAGFEVLELLEFNRVGTAAWWLNGKVMRRRDFGLVQIALLNLLTPVFRRVDRALPLPPLSLIAILEPKSEPPATAGARSDPAAA
jgi:glycosyltransferase involved in cell wall biosynthesis/phospholipid N-methyltransferase